PRRGSDFVQAVDLLDLKAQAGYQALQRLALKATPVTHGAVERAVKGGMLRRQYHQYSAVVEASANRFDRRARVLDVFEHVQAEHGIEPPVAAVKIRRVFRIDAPHSDVGRAQKSIPQSMQMQRILL